MILPTRRSSPNDNPSKDGHSRDRQAKHETQSEVAGEIDIDRARSNPAAVFDHPRDVLNCSLSKKEKAAILRRWRYDAAELSVATEEGMGGGQSILLDQVIRAQRALGDGRERTSDSGLAAKQGLT